MAGGYIGLRSRRRRRYQLLFFLFILVIGLIIFFSSNTKNINVDKIETTDEVFNKENTDVVRKLESKIFEKDQKLELLRNVITSLRTQIDVLEKNNKELINTIQKLNLENKEKNLNIEKNLNLEKSNREKIKQLNNKIDILNEELIKIKDNYSSIKKKNEQLTNQLGILENNNQTLQLQKNIALEKIENLNKITIEKNKLIIEKDKLINNLKDKLHH